MDHEDRVGTARTAGWIVLLWIGCHTVLILGHVALIFLYSITVAPDLPAAEYTAFAERSGPWYSIVAGAPVFYLAGRILVRRAGRDARRAGLIVWALYSACDLAVVLAVKGTMPVTLVGPWIVSQTVKLIAVWRATRATGS